MDAKDGMRGAVTFDECLKGTWRKAVGNIDSREIKPINVAHIRLALRDETESRANDIRCERSDISERHPP